MPIPIIIGAVAVGAGLYGAAKGVSGAMDKSKAKDINADAETMVNKANSTLDFQREKTNKVLESYGQRKLRAFNGTIADFINEFGKIKNIDLSDSPELDKLTDGDFSSTSLEDLKKQHDMLQNAGLGLGAGLGSGAALAFGAYNGTMLLATASTGTAISSLSGAAATNATLAWLGGGSLAAGGYGVAGGMMVLGGIVAGPALAIFGHIMGNKGEEALNQALQNLEQAETVSSEANLMTDKLKAVETVAVLANTSFSKLSTQLRRGNYDMKKVIAQEGEDFGTYSESGKDTVFRTVKLAQLVKAMIDTPILDQDGNLVLSTEKRIGDIVAVANDEKDSIEV